MQVIIFPQDDNKLSVIYPTADYADQIEAVAQKDVPAGKPWRIIDSAELPPTDARDRWRWTESGPLVVAPLPPAPVPTEISRFQAKAALANIHKLDAANAAVAASDNVVLKLAWAEAPTFPRTSPGINALAPALGLSQDDLDNLFRQAVEITA